MLLVQRTQLIHADMQLRLLKTCRKRPLTFIPHIYVASLSLLASYQAVLLAGRAPCWRLLRYEVAKLLAALPVECVFGIHQWLISTARNERQAHIVKIWIALVVLSTIVVSIACMRCQDVACTCPRVRWECGVRICGFRSPLASPIYICHHGRDEVVRYGTGVVSSKICQVKMQHSPTSRSENVLCVGMRLLEA